MCEKLKNEFINEVQIELSGLLDIETARSVMNIISYKINNYDFIEKTRELTIVENESEAMVKMFLATRKLEGRTDKTIKAYARRIREFMNYIMKPLNDVTINDLRAYLAEKQMSGCSNRTTDGYRAILSSFFKWAYGESLIEKCPVDNLGVIKYRRDVELPFSRVELEKIKSCCTTIRDRAIVETLIATGCRVGELTTIEISNINFKNLEIKVLGKGEKERLVYIDTIAAMWIQKYLKERVNCNNKYLFLGKANQRLQEGGVRKMLSKVGEIAEVDNVHPHRFRRTFATTLIGRGMNVQDVAQILGHEDINTTMGYVHMNREHLKHSYERCV